MVIDFKKSTYCTNETLEIFNSLHSSGITYSNLPIRYVLNRISSLCDYCKKDYFKLDDSDIDNYIEELKRINITPETVKIYFYGFNFVNRYVKEHADELNPELINKADFGNTITLETFRLHYLKSTLPTDDMIGRTFGDLTVIRRLDHATGATGGRKDEWECECKCGNHIITSKYYLQHSAITNCGDRRKHRSKRFEDLTGQVFDDYRVLRLIPPETTSRICWECECTTCGSKKVIEARTLKGTYRNTCRICRKKK